MRILFTGASSFTGFWFVRKLARAGHEVVMTLRSRLDDYQGTRLARIKIVSGLGQVVPNCCFGDARFLKLIDEQPAWDLLCHHAAEVANYQSPSFDAIAALRSNTLNIQEVLAALVRKQCGKVILTGSVFEAGEGAGSDGLPSFSPYGLSKALTSQVFAHYARAQEMRLGKFVIPNPFGPYEEPRFTSYLMRSWYEGRTPSVKTPDYVRDNIHVSLLARTYADFVASLPTVSGCGKTNPSGYAESQGSFAQRFAQNMRDRLNLPCELLLETQTEFSEPRIRINIDPPDRVRLGWDEARAWDDLAEYYERTYARHPTGCGSRMA